MAQRELALALLVVATVRVAPEQAAIRRRPYAEQVRDRAQAVEPRELLALGAAARVVPDRNFMDPITEAEHACSDVRLDVEPVAPEVQPAPEVRPQRLVAALQV